MIEQHDEGPAAPTPASLLVGSCIAAGSVAAGASLLGIGSPLGLAVVFVVVAVLTALAAGALAVLVPGEAQRVALAKRMSRGAVLVGVAVVVGLASLWVVLASAPD